MEVAMPTLNMSDSQADIVERILREHDALRHKIHAIHSVLADHNPETSEIESLLRDFLNALVVHFANEEGDEFFGDIRAKSPTLAVTADRLSIEHRELLHEAEELCRFAECGSPSIPWWRELASRSSRFNQRLMHHECEENELMSKSHLLTANKCNEAK
jgi:iron-sulfur cluster repair protein YtfE (RIC family)